MRVTFSAVAQSCSRLIKSINIYFFFVEKAKAVGTCKCCTILIIFIDEYKEQKCKIYQYGFIGVPY